MIEIAKLTQFNEKAEAQAIFDYTEMIRVISESEIDEELKDELNAKIAELIADELNHQKVLQEIYVELTSIEPKVD